MLVYLHGFNSSAASFKARLLGERLAALGRGDEYRCPDLPHRPAAAMQLLEDLIAASREPVALVGSSLGGYYATSLAERYAVPAVLVNPAVRPAESLARHLGRGTLFHSDEPFEFLADHLQELRAFEVQQVSRPDRCLLIAATGDELLDWREMVQAWPGAQTLVIEGSDHALSDFDRHIHRVLSFAGIGPAPASLHPDRLTGETHS